MLVDETADSIKAIPYAAAIADALGAGIALVQVLEAGDSRATPDPVEWRLHRQVALGRLQHLAARAGTGRPVSVCVESGLVADEVARIANEAGVHLTVVCDHPSVRDGEHGVGAVARFALERMRVPFLVVPSSVAEAARVRYRRIMVPLDGSARAESALPIAVRVAAAERAELVLVHVVPRPEFTEFGPPQPGDIELRAAVRRRNERMAEQYLRRIASSLRDRKVPLRTRIMREDGDVRDLLMRAVAEESIDLLVLSSHGVSGNARMNMGSTASHLCLHPPVPVLLIRNSRSAGPQWSDRTARGESRQARASNPQAR